MHYSDFILHSQQSARTESENLRDHIKEQAQLIVRLEREKEEGNSEQDQLLRTRQEESQHLIRELEEMLEVRVGRAMDNITV